MTNSSSSSIRLLAALLLAQSAAQPATAAPCQGKNCVPKADVQRPVKIPVPVEVLKSRELRCERAISDPNVTSRIKLTNVGSKTYYVFHTAVLVARIDRPSGPQRVEFPGVTAIPVQGSIVSKDAYDSWTLCKAGAESVIK